MSLNTLDRLLATLDVQLHAFAVCDVAEGVRLAFDSMDVVVIHYVLDGEGWLEVEGNRPQRIAAGHILIVPPGRAQALVAGETASVDVPAGENSALVVDGLVKFDAADRQPGALRTICSTVTASYGDSFGLFDRLPAPIVEDATDIPAVSAGFRLLAEERNDAQLGTSALTGAVMKQCLVLVVRRHLARGSTASPFFAQLADARLARAVALVLERPGAPLTLAELAGAAGMSRSSFAAAFSETFGQTPMDFVQKARLHRAALLLASTGLPVKVIAATAGFASRSHFSRAFSRAYGADPSGYRRRHDRNPVDPPANAGRNWLTGT